MKTEECGLFTREWGTGLAKTKGHELQGKRPKYPVKSGKKFYAKAFTVQYTGALWSKNTMLRIQATTYHFLPRSC